jgi:peroxiredoxin
VALPATTGGETSLARIVGLVVLFIYPWTGRPGLSNPPDWDTIPGAHGSTPEAEGFRDLYAEYRARGAEVFGLSCQGEGHQRELASRTKLPYALLSDSGHLFRRALALPAFETGGVSYLKRLTLVVGDGRLVRTFFPVHPPDAHPAEVLEWLCQNPLSP